VIAQGHGWLRASKHKLATNPKNMFKQKPTPLQSIPTFLASDEQPMPANEFVPAWRQRADGAACVPESP